MNRSMVRGSSVLGHLGVADAVTIGYSEYDNLFVVMTGPQPKMLWLHFR